MRTAVAFLLFVPFATAAPVPKEAVKPPVELSVSARIPPQELTITVRNNGKEDLKYPFSALPIELFEIEIRDAKGKLVPFQNPAMLSSIFRRGTLTVPAGGTAEVELRLIRGLFPGAERPAGKFTVVARLKAGDKIYASEPLVIVQE